jgi:hypothetical protein
VRDIGEQALLAAWEAALGQHPLDRALTLAGVIRPGVPRAELASLTVGARDALLLELRERLFGGELAAFAACPGCGTALELGTRTGELRAGPAASGVGAIEVGDMVVRFRAPTSRDLATVLAEADEAAARGALLERIVIEARRGTELVPARALGDDVVARLDERLAEMDPQADMQLALTCPACQSAWQAPFDIVTFIWTEIDVWARRLLGTVDALARAYGWREPDVLALGPRRREMYLELAGA